MISYYWARGDEQPQGHYPTRCLSTVFSRIFLLRKNNTSAQEQHSSCFVCSDLLTLNTTRGQVRQRITEYFLTWRRVNVFLFSRFTFIPSIQYKQQKFGTLVSTFNSDTVTKYMFKTSSLHLLTAVTSHRGRRF